MRQRSNRPPSTVNSGKTLRLLTKCTVGACRYILEQEGLWQFFEQVFGMLGQFYGESDFDRANQEPSLLEGGSDCELSESKANLIRRMTHMEMEELRRLSGAKAAEKSPAPAAPPPVAAPSTEMPKACALPREQKGHWSLKHIYFDFDENISKIHVFKQLAWWEPGVEAPHALSERGQIHRLKMLNTQQWTYESGTGHVVRCAAGTPGARWTSCALGGPVHLAEVCCDLLVIYDRSRCIDVLQQLLRQRVHNTHKCTNTYIRKHKDVQTQRR